MSGLPSTTDASPSPREAEFSIVIVANGAAAMVRDTVAVAVAFAESTAQLPAVLTEPQMKLVDVIEAMVWVVSPVPGMLNPRPMSQFVNALTVVVLRFFVADVVVAVTACAALEPGGLTASEIVATEPATDLMIAREPTMLVVPHFEIDEIPWFTSLCRKCAPVDVMVPELV